MSSNSNNQGSCPKCQGTGYMYGPFGVRCSDCNPEQKLDSNQACSKCGYIHMADQCIPAGQMEFEQVQLSSKCQCGAHVVGFSEAGPNHSIWCDLWRDFKN